MVIASLSAGTLHAQQKAALGVTMSDNTPGGVLITKVLDGSPAAKIGLQAGDRVLAINGERTNNYHDFGRIIGASRPDAPVELTIVRGAWKTKLTAKLGSAGVVFTPAPKFVPAPLPTHTASGAPPAWSPFSGDNGEEGASASYGGGGY
jgi:membrane-associated protease RseP (regulator of RpoE activity)